MFKSIPASILHLLVTGLIGFAYFLIGQCFYPYLTDKLWTPFGIALYFVGFGVVVFLAMLVLNQIRRDYSFFAKANKLGDYWRAYRRGALCVVLILPMACGFEFLYELAPIRTHDPTSYVFVIDDSGSMASNDSNNKRLPAIKTIMEQSRSDLPYAVYRFTDDVELVKDMSLYSGSDTFEFASSGNTNIMQSLNTVISHLSDGTLNGGDYPRILVLSDGESSAAGWEKIVSDSRGSNVTISAIGFGYDSDLLRNVAERTGGVFVQVDDVDQLAQHMRSAITSSAQRNLISFRPTMENDLLFAIMRVAFLALIGLVWSMMKFLTYCSADASLNYRVLQVSVVLCVVSSLAMEVLFQRFWVSPALIRALFCVLWAITPGFFIRSTSVDELVVDVLPPNRLDSDHGDGLQEVLTSSVHERVEEKRLSDVWVTDDECPTEESSGWDIGEEHDAASSNDRGSSYDNDVWKL